jgi:hypothetical protein
MSAPVTSLIGSSSLTVKPSSHASRSQLKHRRRALLPFHWVISTRSEPHWQNSTTGTKDESTRQAKKTQNVASDCRLHRFSRHLWAYVTP